MYHYQNQDNNNTVIKVSVTKCHGTHTEKDKTEEIFGKRFCCLTGGRQAWLKGECPRKMHRFSSDMSWLPGPTSLHHNGLLSLSKTRGNCKSFFENFYLEYELLKGWIHRALILICKCLRLSLMASWKNHGFFRR